MAAHHPSTFRAMFALPWQHRHLLTQLVRREVLGRYRGSLMGILWSFVTPALMLSDYTFVFSVVFQARWNTSAGSGDKVEFALILFSLFCPISLFHNSI